MLSQTVTEVGETQTNTDNDPIVIDTQNLFEGLTIEKIQATKKQNKQVDIAYKFCQENSFRVSKKEFDALMSGKGKWLQTSAMFSQFLWGKVLTLPEDFKRYAKVYVLTYDAEEGYISTSFWVYYDEMLFRDRNLGGIQNIFSHLEVLWLSEFRDYVEDILNNAEAVKIISQDQSNVNK